MPTPSSSRSSPTGRLLSKRWRWVPVVLALALVTGIPGQGFSTDNAENPLPIDSPIIDLLFNASMILLLLGLAGAIVALVIRFRRSVGLERLQLKQLVLAASFILPVGALAVIFWYDSYLVRVLLGASLLALPVAAGLAILRYRLRHRRRHQPHPRLRHADRRARRGLPRKRPAAAAGTQPRSPRARHWPSLPRRLPSPHCSAPPGPASRQPSTDASSAPSTTRAQTLSVLRLPPARPGRSRRHRHRPARRGQQYGSSLARTSARASRATRRRAKTAAHAWTSRRPRPRLTAAPQGSARDHDVCGFSFAAGRDRDRRLISRGRCRASRLPQPMSIGWILLAMARSRPLRRRRLAYGGSRRPLRTHGPLPRDNLAIWFG